jgi:DNA polymerase-3 subunit alpha
MKGLIEVILFPEVFKAGATLLRSGDPIVVRGTLDLSDENQAKIKALDIQPLSETPSTRSKILHVRVPITSLTPALLEDMKKIVLVQRGECALRLHLTNGKDRETVIALSDQYRVDSSPAFQKSLQQLFESATLSLE